jgi:AmiR/NasT family two-component response regulator
VAQAFADIASLLIVHSDPVDLDQLSDRVEQALRSRVAVERAKGVVAERDAIDMDEAYQRLIELAVARGSNLTEVARSVTDAAARGRSLRSVDQSEGG